MNVIEAQPNEFNVIRYIAEQTWTVTYGNILSAEQLHYMLSKLYSDEKLNRDSDNGHFFYLAENEADEPLGFLGIEHHHNGEATTKIHKIYILPETQGQGIGKALMEKAEELALQHGSKKLVLNVNRYNKAKSFYEKLGFVVTSLEDIDIGEGFLMEDYVMEKGL